MATATATATAMATSPFSGVSYVSLPDSSSFQNPIFSSYTSRSQLKLSQQIQSSICMQTTGKDLKLRKPFLLSMIHCTRDPKVKINHEYQFSGKINGTGGHSIRRMDCQIGNKSQTLSSAAPVVTKDSWDKSILNSEVPVLVEFYANWCGPCKMVHRVIDDIAVEYAGRLNCFVLNTDNDLQVAEGYDIKAVPVVLLFKNGKKFDSVIGTMPKEFYASAVEKILIS